MPKALDAKEIAEAMKDIIPVDPQKQSDASNFVGYTLCGCPNMISISVTKQAGAQYCARSTVYYLPRPVSAADLGLMRSAAVRRYRIPRKGCWKMRWLKTPATKSIWLLACRDFGRPFVHTQALCFINYTSRAV